MKYFIDTEFNDRGPDYPIRLISLGIISEDDRELYLVARDEHFDPDSCNNWVKKNVLPRVKDSPRTPISDFSVEIEKFVGNDSRPQFVGYYCCRDWVLFMYLFNPPHPMPSGWRRLCYDVAQLKADLGGPKMPPKSKMAHHALEDARWTKIAYFYLKSILDKDRFGGFSVEMGDN